MTRSKGAVCGFAMAALVGRAHAQSEILAAIPENTVVEIGAYECTAPAGEVAGACDHIVDFSGMVYDAGRHQILMFGGGHASVFTDTISALDLTTLRWRDLYEPTPCSSMTLENIDWELGAWTSGPSGPYPRPFSTHTYDLLGVVGNEFVLASSGSGRGGCAPETGGGDDFIAAGRFAHYDLVAGTWRFTEAARVFVPSMELDPISGLFVLVGRQSGAGGFDGGLATYDPVAGSLASALPDASDGDMGLDGALVYFPPTDRFYYFGAPDGAATVYVWEVAPDRGDWSRSTVTRLAPSGSAPSNRRAWAFDSGAEVIGGGMSGGVFHAFDPRAVAWSSQEVEGEARPPEFQAFVYDPVDQVYVFVGGERFDMRTFAYRYRPLDPTRDAGPLARRDGGGTRPDAGAEDAREGGGLERDGGESPTASLDGTAGVAGDARTSMRHGSGPPDVTGGCGCALASRGGSPPVAATTWFALGLALLARKARAYGRRT